MPCRSRYAVVEGKVDMLWHLVWLKALQAPFASQSAWTANSVVRTHLACVESLDHCYYYFVVIITTFITVFIIVVIIIVISHRQLEPVSSLA